MGIRSEQELLQRKAELARVLRMRLGAPVLDAGGSERLTLVFDLEMHLAFLGEALRLATPRLFTEYMRWSHQLLVSAGGDGRRLDACLTGMASLITDAAEGPWAVAALAVLDAARQALGQEPEPAPTHWREDNPHRALGEAFLDACLQLRRHQALALVNQAARNGTPVTALYHDVITPTLHELGRLWQLNRITVAQEHYCTAVAQTAMAQLFPLIFDRPQPPVGRLVATCVAGELHEIGARMVADLFEIDGWDTTYLGAGVPHESVVDTLVQTQAQVLALSVTLAAHLGEASTLIGAVRASPACAAVKILAGGAAFNAEPTLWQSLGCDGWAADPSAALELARGWRS